MAVAMTDAKYTQLNALLRTQLEAEATYVAATAAIATAQAAQETARQQVQAAQNAFSAYLAANRPSA